MAETFDQYSTEIKKQLSGYGQDLAMAGAENWAQRFGTPDIALALIPVAVWFLKTVLEAIIDCEVKKKYEKDILEKRIAEIEARIKAIEILVESSSRKALPVQEATEQLSLYYSEVLEEYESLGKPDYHLNSKQEEKLINTLQSLGLTRRKAIKLSTQVIEGSENALSKG